MAARVSSSCVFINGLYYNKGKNRTTATIEKPPVSVIGLAQGLVGRCAFRGFACGLGGTSATLGEKGVGHGRDKRCIPDCSF